MTVMARGRLRIYLGAAPGVGKTVAMLDEGHRRLDRGTDVVIGFVETHGRPHTRAELEGLERAPAAHADPPRRHPRGARPRRPPRPATRRSPSSTSSPTPTPRGRATRSGGRTSTSCSTPASTSSRPSTSSTSSRSTTSSTSITGHRPARDRPRRRRPLGPTRSSSSTCRPRRCAGGWPTATSTPAEKVDAALANYFRVGNLSALRELALLWLADRVDEGLEPLPRRPRHRGDVADPRAGRRRPHRRARGRDPPAPGRPDRRPRGRRRAARRPRRAADGLVGPALPDPRRPAPADHRARRRRCTPSTGERPRRRRSSTSPAASTPRQVVIGSSRRAQVAQPRSRRARPRRSSRGPATSTSTSSPTGSPSGRGWRASRAALPQRRVRLGYLAAVVGPFLVTELLAGLPEDPELPLTCPSSSRSPSLIALLGGMGPALVGAVASSLVLNWFFTATDGRPDDPEPAERRRPRWCSSSSRRPSRRSSHRSARRADRAVRAQRGGRRPRRAEPHPPRLDRPDGRSCCARRSTCSAPRRRPSCAGRAPRPLDRSSRAPTRPSRLDDLRRPGLPREDGRRRARPRPRRGERSRRTASGLLAAFAAHARRHPAAPVAAGLGGRGARPRPGQPRAHRAAVGRLARPAHPARRHQGGDRQPALQTR